jgi:hypothetical protein
MRQPTIHQMREKKKSSRKSQGSRKVTTYYIDYKYNLSKQLSTNLKHYSYL